MNKKNIIITWLWIILSLSACGRSSDDSIGRSYWRNINKKINAVNNLYVSFPDIIPDTFVYKNDTRGFDQFIIYPFEINKMVSLKNNKNIA